MGIEHLPPTGLYGGETPERAAAAYHELKRLARHYLAGERRGHTLQTTALAHEAYIRLAALDRVAWRDRTHFLATAARQMRRVLVEHARAAKAVKRGSGARPISLHDHLSVTPASSIEMLALDEALERLAHLHARQSRVAEMRLFSGLEVQEIARVLGVTDRTIKRDWRVARAWLVSELS